MGRKSKRGSVKRPTPGPPPLRTKEERQIEVKKILEKLCELNLTTEHDEVKELMSIMRDYVTHGNEVSIDIPFPMIKRRIKGVLTAYQGEPVCVKLAATD